MLLLLFQETFWAVSELSDTTSLWITGVFFQDYWKVKACKVMLWTRFCARALILRSGFVQRKHFSLRISFWQKKPQGKIQASFIISFFCYFITPLFTYICVNSTVLHLRENTVSPNILCGLFDWKIQQAGFLAELWVWFTLNGLINCKMPYCWCLCARKLCSISAELLTVLCFWPIDLL